MVIKTGLPVFDLKKNCLELTKTALSHLENFSKNLFLAQTTYTSCLFLFSIVKRKFFIRMLLHFMFTKLLRNTVFED